MTPKLRMTIAFTILSLLIPFMYKACMYLSYPEDRAAGANTPAIQDSLSVFESGIVDPSVPLNSMKTQLKDPDIEPAKTTSLSLIKPIYNPDSGGKELVPFPGQMANTSSLKENIAKYEGNPTMQAFLTELQSALGQQTTFKEVISPSFDKETTGNPKVQKILLKYTKDPKFVELMQNMASDQKFMDSFAQEASRNTEAAGPTENK